VIGDPAETVFVNQPWVATRTDPGPVVEPGLPVADTVEWGNLAAGDLITISAWVFPVEDRTLAVADWVCDIPADQADWPPAADAGKHVVTASEAVAGSWTSDTPVGHDQSGYCVAFQETTTDATGKVTKSRGRIGDPAETVFVNQPWVGTRTDSGPVVEPGQPVADVVEWGDLAAGDVITVSAWVFPVQDRSLTPEDWSCDIPADQQDWPEPIPAGAHTVTREEAVAGSWTSDTPVGHDQSGYCVAFQETTTDAAGKATKSRGVVGDRAETVFVNRPEVSTRTDPVGVARPGDPILDTVAWRNLAEGDLIEVAAWVFPVADPTGPVEDWVCAIPADEADWPAPLWAGSHTVTRTEAVEGYWTSDTPVSHDQSGYCVAFQETTTDGTGEVVKSKGRIGDPAETVFVDQGAQAPFLAFTGSRAGLIVLSSSLCGLAGMVALAARRRLSRDGGGPVG
jgi:hypothetical protein